MNNIEFTFSPEDLQTCLNVTSTLFKGGLRPKVYGLTDGNFLSIHLLENWHGGKDPKLQGEEGNYFFVDL